MAKEQRTFTKEFKLEAVRLVQTSGKSITQVARDLGIADSTLHHWCKLEASQGEQAFVGSRHQTAQEEELRRLKRELEVVRQERDILKCAVSAGRWPLIEMRSWLSKRYTWRFCADIQQRVCCTILIAAASIPVALIRRCSLRPASP
jgi:transposase